jgi:hypothetical protein
MTYIPSRAWDVEYTDEFENWWLELSAEEQESITASVGLLEERARTFPFRIRLESTGLAMDTCESCEFNTEDGRTECSMRSILGGSLCY